MNIDSEGYIRNIVKEIVRECNVLNVKTNQNFVMYFVKLLLLNPNWGITSDSIVTRENVQEFVKFVVEELKDDKSKPKILTLKMQFYFSCSMQNLKQAVKENRSRLKNRLRILKKNIMSVSGDDLSDKKEVDLLFKKITIYITLLSGLGNPEIESVYDEASAAFRSMLSEDELKEFTSFDVSEKDMCLDEYTKIVTGIRLFNKNCNKGGEGIEDLPSLLDKAIDALRRELQDRLIAVMDGVNLLTTLIDKCYIQTATENGYEMLFECPTVSKTSASKTRIFKIEDAKALLILYRQYELLTRQMMEEYSNLQNNAKSIFEKIEHNLKRVHRAVHMRIAIPVGIVFPLFVDLADSWTELQDQVLMLSKLNDILNNLDKFAKEASFCKDFYESFLGEEKVLTDAERLEATADYSLQAEYTNKILMYKLDDIQMNIDTQLQYHGFCPWKLVETDGALIPGNSSMGIIRYQNMNFVFSTPEAGAMFSQNPDDYVMHVLSLARNVPQLINFLGLQEQLKNVMHIGVLVEEPEEIIECDSQAIQTCYHHPEMDEETNRKYKWNIWDHKREALKMANALTELTHFSQTDKSYSKISVGTQTYYPKQAEQQTKKDIYTNVPKPSVYMYGLRGRKDDKQFKIHLTQPVDK